MLPDLPTLKRNVMGEIVSYLSMRVHQKLGVLGEIPRQQLHEGDRMRVVREDGTVEDSAFHQSSATGSIATTAVPSLSAEERLAMMENLADAMARDMSLHMFGSIEKTLEEYDQTVNLHGQPLGPEAVLEMLGKMRMDFDETGNPVGLSVVVPPQLLEQWKSVLQQMHEDPVLRQRHDELIERKRGEWRDREASRKLVG